MAASKISSVKAALLAAGLEAITSRGYEAATIDEIRRSAGASNGSFFHFFPNKQALATAIFVNTLQQYHAAIMAALTPTGSAAEGIERLITAHVEWVVTHRGEALFLSEQSRSEWIGAAREEQAAVNRELRDGIDAWREPLLAAGELAPMTMEMFFSQITGPAQMFCRAWLSGRSPEDPRDQLQTLVACAIKALKPDC